MNAPARLLVVDDDRDVVDYLLEMLRDDGHDVVGTTDADDALARVSNDGFDLVIADVEMPKLRGTELMAAIHAKRPEQLVLLITAFGSIDTAVKAVKAGACDFITKPFRHEVLQVAVERAFRERRMRREIVRLRSALRPQTTPEIVAHSGAMQRVVDVARRVAGTATTVLVTGESGVGKGLIARFIHDGSPRAAGPFVQVNCAAVPAAIAESELFGARRGAYTGAAETREGLFGRAHAGTLFLDEIGEMPVEVQAKLLQSIETGRIRPVGSASEEDADVRLVAATNRPLEDAVESGRFRADLFYRLNVVRIDIPPLRERPEDLQPLIDVLLERVCERIGRPLLGISEDALRWLLAYHWPGNVRELSNILERAVVLADHDVLVLDDIVLPDARAGEDGFLERAARRGLSLSDVERAYIQAVVTVTSDNKTEAARILGIDRRTLYRRLEGG
jgi:DNA-binding NtrC family response regulator